MRWLAVLLGLLASVSATRAGSTCEARATDPRSIAAAAQTALRVVDALEASAARVAVIARVGSDLTRHGLVYSHAGFVVRDHPDGVWTVVHLLNDCGTERSALHAQGLVDFFADDLVNQDARIVWLRPELQQRLHDRLRGADVAALHVQRYSIIARPGSREFQNSTAWILETIAAATTARHETDRVAAYRIAERGGFRPDHVRIAWGKRVVGGLFAANANFTDHALATRLAGDYPVVTVRAIIRYLEDAGLATGQAEWRNGRPLDRPGPA